MMADREEFAQMLKDVRDDVPLEADALSEGEGYSSMEIPEPKAPVEEPVVVEEAEAEAEAEVEAEVDAAEEVPEEEGSQEEGEKK